MKIDANEIGNTSYEYTISGIHTKMYPGSLNRDPNKRRVDGFDGEPNFFIFGIESIGGKTKLNFKASSLYRQMINRTDSI
jgi:hypothetical protein